MKVKVLFFASLRERLGVGNEEVVMPAGVQTVDDLRHHLSKRGASWESLAQTGNLRCAVNQQMAQAQALLHEGDEVAFFPPVTGG